MQENLREKKNCSLQLCLFLLLLNFAPCRVHSLYKKLRQGEVLHSSAEKTNQTSGINPAVVQPWAITWDPQLCPSVTQVPRHFALSCRWWEIQHTLTADNMSTWLFSFLQMMVAPVLFCLYLADTEKHHAPFLTKFSHYPMSLLSLRPS